VSANPVGVSFAVAGGFVLVAVIAALACPPRARAAAVGAFTAAGGAAGAVAGGFALAGHTWSAQAPDLLPLGGLYLRIDALAGVFVAVTGVVVAVAAIYGIGYFREHGSNRVVQAIWPCFALALLLVPIAASVSTLLYAWELMALTSLVLVCTGHGAETLSAGVWYAVLTHLGLVAVLAGLVWLAAATHTETFAGIAAASPGISPSVKGFVFVLVLAGFGSKAGMVPLHAWLPRAHPEAPSPVSAVMSAAMVNLGVYGLIRVGFDLLHGGSRWWWLTALLLGALSAVYGIIQAAVATDLKRLLAYSTVENLGLILLAVGAAGIFQDSGQPLLAALALAAGLLHAATHGAFKTLLFLGAGSVLHATGTRDLDELGGLRTRMPVTSALFALGAIGAAALPGGAGFPSEWLLLQSLIHGRAVPGATVLVMLPVAVGAVALSAGLAVATFVKAVGTGFLAKPRSLAADHAREAPVTMLAGMSLAGLGCAGFALVPGLAGPALGRAVAASGLAGGQVAGSEVAGRLTALGSALSPLLVVGAVVLAAVILRAALALVVRTPRRAAVLWDCGAPTLTARMEYTATSFAEPLQRVFDDVLAPESDLDVTPHEESAYLIERVAYARAVPDRIEHRLYLPVIHTVRRAGRAAGIVANGSVHRYLGYGFSAVIVLLVVLAAAR
jgi:formate hydrogenlyase subunit 3/multisubunit Na+/H+ antiporter MnhD subunit